MYANSEQNSEDLQYQYQIKPHYYLLRDTIFNTMHANLNLATLIQTPTSEWLLKHPYYLNRPASTVTTG